MIAPTPLNIMGSSCAWRHLALDCVESTNDIALQQASDGASEGLIITARQQTKGRGRLGRKWFADNDDALLMSLLLRPDWLQISDAPQLSLLTALALYNAFEIDDKRVKWPNDLLVAGNKLAGVLMELRSGPTMQSTVIVAGIGINLREPVNGWPSDLRTPATSIATLGLPILTAHQCMLKVIAAFDHLYSCYRDGGFAPIAEQWWQAHGGRQQVEVDDGKQCRVGTATGLDDDGALLVCNEQGEQRVISSDVSLLAQDNYAAYY